MEGHRWFSNSYTEAADRFLSACEDLRRAGHSVESERLEIGLEGPSGEPLCIDAAFVGSPSSDKAVLSSSGIHGVEGYPGSAIQLSIMDGLARGGKFYDGAIIFVHVINPYGMAWLRRYNEGNVDLNRNFLCRNQHYSGTPEGYYRIKDFINPASPPLRGDCSFGLKALRQALRHGYRNLKQWIAEGQYEHPEAIQFGGKKLERGPELLLQWLDRALEKIDEIWAIDLHTGLGPRGHDTILVSSGMDEALAEKLDDLFPGHIERLNAKAGIGYEMAGDLHQGLEGRYDRIKWTSITQEFGTLKPLDVLKAIRDENRWTQWGKYANQREALRHWSRRRVLRTFSPDDPSWQEEVVSRGKAVFETAIRDLMGTAKS